MGKFSNGKVVLALSIISLYVFLFGIMGRIDLSAENAHEITVDFTSEDNGQGTPGITSTAPPDTTILLSDYIKPAFVDYSPKETTAEETTEETTDIPSQPEIPPVDDTDYVSDDLPMAETPQIYTDEPTTPQKTEEETTEYIEQGPPVHTDSTVEVVPPNPDNGDDILSVNYNGEVVSAPANEIVAQIVVAEIWNQFDIEAIKAQAVAAYTYVKKSNLRGDAPNVVLKTDIYDRVQEAVNEVVGEAIYHNGQLIEASYCASTAGYSNSAENTWGYGYPYLVSVECSFDAQYDPNYGIKQSFTSSEIKNAVKETLGISLSGDPASWFKINSTLNDRNLGYVTSISVGGKNTYGDNQKPITGRVIRETVLDRKIKSAAFTLAYNKGTDEFTFTTYGYGHGVGLSQHGANILASKFGYSYKEILKHYFTGVEIY